MKYLGILLLFCATKAAAQAGVQVVHEVAQSTNTITQSIWICSSNNALDVANATSTGTIAGAFAIEVYSPSASTVTINCGFDVNLSSALNSAWYGREVLAGTGVYWAKLSKRILYCMTQNSSGCTRATITQFK